MPGSTHYSTDFYFVTKEIISGSHLQGFVDGDDEFRNSRLKLILSVPEVNSCSSPPCQNVQHFLHFAFQLYSVEQLTINHICESFRALG